MSVRQQRHLWFNFKLAALSNHLFHYSWTFLTFNMLILYGTRLVHGFKCHAKNSLSPTPPKLFLWISEIVAIRIFYGSSPRFFDRVSHFPFWFVISKKQWFGNIKTHLVHSFVRNAVWVTKITFSPLHTPLAAFQATCLKQVPPLLNS